MLNRLILKSFIATVCSFILVAFISYYASGQTVSFQTTPNYFSNYSYGSFQNGLFDVSYYGNNYLYNPLYNLWWSWGYQSYWWNANPWWDYNSWLNPNPWWNVNSWWNPSSGRSPSSPYGGIGSYQQPKPVLASINIDSDVDPDTIVLTSLGKTRQLAVKGIYTDGGTSDLTSSTKGTEYVSSDPNIASVNADGLVTAVANGTATVTAESGNFSDSVSIIVHEIKPEEQHSQTDSNGNSEFLNEQIDLGFLVTIVDENGLAKPEQNIDFTLTPGLFTLTISDPLEQYATLCYTGDLSELFAEVEPGKIVGQWADLKTGARVTLISGNPYRFEFQYPPQGTEPCLVKQPYIRARTNYFSEDYLIGEGYTILETEMVRWNNLTAQNLFPNTDLNTLRLKLSVQLTLAASETEPGLQMMSWIPDGAGLAEFVTTFTNKVTSNAIYKIYQREVNITRPLLYDFVVVPLITDDRGDLAFFDERISKEITVKAIDENGNYLQNQIINFGITGNLFTLYLSDPGQKYATMCYTGELSELLSDDKAGMIVGSWIDPKTGAGITLYGGETPYFEFKYPPKNTKVCLVMSESIDDRRDYLCEDCLLDEGYVPLAAIRGGGLTAQSLLPDIDFSTAGLNIPVQFTLVVSETESSLKMMKWINTAGDMDEFIAAFTSEAKPYSIYRVYQKGPGTTQGGLYDIIIAPVQTDIQGKLSFFDEQIGNEVEVTLLDEQGVPIPNQNVSFSLAGNLFTLCFSDPSQKYAPICYEGEKAELFDSANSPAGIVTGQWAYPDPNTGARITLYGGTPISVEAQYSPQGTQAYLVRRGTASDQKDYLNESSLVSRGYGPPTTVKGNALTSASLLPNVNLDAPGLNILLHVTLALSETDPSFKMLKWAGSRTDVDEFFTTLKSRIKAEDSYKIYQRQISGTYPPLYDLIIVPAPKGTPPLTPPTTKPALTGLAQTAWPYRRHDLRQTGQSPYLGAQTDTVRWKFKTGAEACSSPVVGNGMIYVGSHDNCVYALRESDGSLVWKFLTGGWVVCSPVIGNDGTVFVGSDDNYLYALDGSTGSVKWKYKTGSKVWGSAAIGSDGTVYTGSYDTCFYALNGSNGTLKWRYQTGGEIQSAPAIGSDGTIYISSMDGFLYALNSSNGSMKWHFGAGDSIFASPALASDGTIYISSLDGNLYALDSSNGGNKWHASIGEPIYSSPAISDDGTIYFGAADNYLYAMSPDGQIKWRYRTGSYIVASSPAIGKDGTVYIGSQDNYFYAVDGKTGSLKWRYRTGNLINASPAIGQDGTVYVDSWDSYIYAFGENTITIADPQLEAAIRSALSIGPAEPITEEMALTLNELWARSNGIRKLGGLEHFTNLTKLSLPQNPISEISALAGLTNLTTLDLTHNEISDISALAGLTNLTTLDLTHSLPQNQISDISALAGLTNLTTLRLSNNPISDISALAGLTNLTTLDLSYTEISDISALAGLTNLTTLKLSRSYNQISDISALAGLTNLTSLDLSWNQISDISALAGLTNLTTLDITNTSLDSGDCPDIQALTARGVAVTHNVDCQAPVPAQSITIADPQLEAAIRSALAIGPAEPITEEMALTLNELWAGGNGIAKLDGLEHFTNLTDLDLSQNQISDISALAGLTNLTWLSLYKDQVSDVSPLAGLTKLTMLNFDNNQTSDISALAGLTNLGGLYLTGNQISDISVLAGLTQLSNLELGDNQITDISALAGLTDLLWLELSGNQISDISALAGLSDLVELDITSTSLDNGDCPVIQALTAGGVTVSTDVVCAP